jgi:hypothetical protein
MNNTSDSYVLCTRGLRKDHGWDASLVRAVACLAVYDDLHCHTW